VVAVILQIRNFVRFQGDVKRDWAYRKLYRAEPCGFASLDWETRGLAALLLKHCDQDGKLDCGDLDIEVAIGHLIRCKATHRRSLLRHLLALIEDGYLTASPPIIRTPSVDHPSTIRQLSIDHPSINGAPSVPVTIGDHSGPKREVSKEVKEKKEKNTTAAEEPCDTSSDHHRFIAAFDALYRKRAGTPPTWKPRQFGIVKALLTEYGHDESVTRAGRMFATWRSGVPTLITLQSNWDSFADDKGPANPVRDVRYGHVRAEDQDWTGVESGKEVKL
jgi:hypothetical protein